MDSLVKIKNTSAGTDNPRDLRFDYQQKITVIKPGETKIVPFEMAEAFFGHPKENNAGKDKNRRVLYDQLRHMHGFYLGFDTQEDWLVKMPPFRVLTMEDEYLPMVLDDPAGEFPLPGELAVASASSADEQVALLQSRIDQLVASQNQLLALVTAQQVVSTPGVAAEVPTNQVSDGAGQGSDGTVDPKGSGDGTSPVVPTPPANEAAPKPDQPRGPRGARIGASS